MSTVIVPVGLNLGPSFRYAAPPDPEPEYFEVRLGTESEELDADEYLAWGGAFVDGDQHARLAVSRASLAAHLRRVGPHLDDPDVVIDGLIDRGLLVEYDPGGPLEKVFRRLRLHPLAEGMGNTPGEPERRRIGHHGRPIVKVTSVVYGLWAFSAVSSSSLWDACATVADLTSRARADGEDLEELTVVEAARQAAAAVPLLVATGCAFLDPAG